ncbi:hypothetical protein [Zooshikella harenae]|uniref:WD40 repeat domain-containing protein n=1 Tax=Zooshikella harenae TaxID=2827238 RepID=A0ABS5Z8T4_9GAMM|nr:hypothetical protein [Zooshikella harenae]MBU2710449.1 hypothetical protein [Zooshikella harenae]
MSACDNTQHDESTTASTEKKIETIEKKLSPEQVNESASGDDTRFQQIALETLNNIASYDQPRIQFLWIPPQAKNRRQLTLWSIKLDGSDLRRVATTKELYGDYRHSVVISSKPVRSPDNRYIIYTFISDKKRIVLLDLVTRERKVIDEGVASARFTWYPDSQRVIINRAYETKVFSLQTGQLSSINHQENAGLYLINEGKQFFAIKKGKYTIYDLQFNKVKSGGFDYLPQSLLHLNSVSNDGRYLAFGYDLFDLKTKQHFTSLSDAPILGIHNDWILISKNGFQKININTRKMEQIFAAPAGGSGRKGVTLYNL